MNTARLERHRAWAVRAAGLLLGGAVGTVPVWLVIPWLSGDSTSLVPLAATTAVGVAAVGLPLWWIVLRPPRTGPGWGALLGAWIPAVLVAALAVVAVAVGDVPSEAGIGGAALLLLAATPLTIVLAAVGALLERVLPPPGVA